MTALNNDFFKRSQFIHKFLEYQFPFSNMRPPSDTNTIVTAMKPSEVIATFSNNQLDIKVVMREFIAGYNIVHNRYDYKVNLWLHIADSYTKSKKHIELYNDTFTIHNDIIGLLHSINNTICGAIFSKVPILDRDSISLVCFLVDYLITLSYVQFPRKAA